MKMNLLRAAMAALAFYGAAAGAQTTVKDAWVRGTVAQQKTSGAFMQITSAHGGRLVSVQSPVAGLAEIHEMSMQGDVMKMHAVTGVDLPAGRPVDLKPGGYHVMLMNLKRPLKEGDIVPITLVIEGKNGTRETLEVRVPVKALNAP